MDIFVGAFDPKEEKCLVNVRLEGNEEEYSGSVEAGVWVENVDSRSELYASAKAEALALLKRAVAALEAQA